MTGDVRLDDGTEAIVHMPSLDMGGKCVAGAEVLLKPARDKKGNPVGADAVGKYGTPKCQYILQVFARVVGHRMPSRHQCPRRARNLTSDVPSRLAMPPRALVAHIIT